MSDAKPLRAKARELAELIAWSESGREAALEPDLPIIDPHHHAWNDKRGRYLMEDLLQDTGDGHNIIATVFVQSGPTMYRAQGAEEMKPVGEVEFANGIAAMSASGLFGKTRLCAGIVGFAELMLGDRVRPVLEAQIAAGNGRLRGIRRNIPYDSSNEGSFPPQVPHVALDAQFRKGLAQVQALGLSFDVWMFHPQLPELADLLRAFPDLPMVLNHVGGVLGEGRYAGKRDEVFKVWSANMCELAQFPNLTVKLGGLGMSRCGWDFHLREKHAGSEELARAWRPYIEFCIESFGVERCMMESNFPVDKISSGYSVLWNALKRITQGCSAAEKAALYRGTAARVYRLDA
ncbi:MAG: amidohydrolase [Bradyrhizobium sp.]|nr:amidohydrolase [Bradyrhizobium sp.]